MSLKWPVAKSLFGRSRPPKFTPNQLLAVRSPYIYFILPNLVGLNVNVACLNVLNFRFTGVNRTE